MKTIVINSSPRKDTYHLNLDDGCRMGDFACFHVWTGEWRIKHPDSRLVVYYNPTHWKSMYSKQLPLEWVFGHAVDQIIVKENPGERYPYAGTSWGDFYRPRARNYVDIWEVWKGFMKGLAFKPTIAPPQEVMDRAAKVLEQYKVPKKYVVLQPLFEAGYHKYRNATPEWWSRVCDEMVKAGIPTVVLGPPTCTAMMRVNDNAYPLWKTVGEAFTSMGINKLSAVHVGGETGLPLWSAIFRVPLVATFWRWKSGGGPLPDCDRFDFRPFSFGAPVVFSQLNGDPAQVAATVKGVFEGTIKDSTPLW